MAACNANWCADERAHEPSPFDIRRKKKPTEAAAEFVSLAPFFRALAECQLNFIDEDSMVESPPVDMVLNEMYCNDPSQFSDRLCDAESSTENDIDDYDADNSSGSGEDGEDADWFVRSKFGDA